MASGSTLIHASEPARALANRVLSPVARGLVAAGVTANAVTAVALALSLAAALLLASGRFAAATPFIVFASIGDALDGVLARMSATASPGGALFDAAADRYQEMAILAGLAIHLREDVASLAIVLAALLASFMVSYGSAKAEALRVPVPPGSMRRLERSVCLCAGVALVPVARALVAALGAATWLAEAPILVALAVVAIVGNASAVARLRVVAALARPTNGEAPGRTQAVRAP